VTRFAADIVSGLVSVALFFALSLVSAALVLGLGVVIYQIVGILL